MNQIAQFQKEVEANIAALGKDTALADIGRDFMLRSANNKYTYNFTWLGRPIIQFPQDVVAMQELIWSVKPDLIIETGIAHGGSLVFSASMLALIDLAEATDVGEMLNPALLRRKVLGVDIDIRPHNRAAIEQHPFASRIEMIQGSSIAPDVVSRVKNIAASYSNVLVCLDSNHTHEHVLAELEAYAPLTSVGSYCVVFDTAIEDMPEDMFLGRPWGRGNNPKTAVWEYVKDHKEFEIDQSVQHKIQITVAPDGFLRRVK
ncbi:cephalosporin hydroxylase [Rhodobacterales bacterium LSUCC0031]|nr:cephalosporin hydroxylase [Rhodobacterales bacterium LSUCC0031]